MKKLDKFVQFAIEDNINYLGKLILDCAPDEPASNGKFLETKACGLSLRKLRVEYAKIIADSTGVDAYGNDRSNYKAQYETLHPGASWEDFQAEMVASILSLQCPVATAWAPDYAEYVDCFAPPYRHYSTAGERAKYADAELRWWYAFVHDIEGNSLPERMLGWMQAEYDIQAQSDWAADTFYDKYNGGVMIDEFFNTNYLRSNYGNGDGFYFYPAAQYELDELIPSFRIQAKVDAYEEYELFYNLKQEYAKIAEETGLDIDPTGVISGLGKNIYNGITCVMDCANFEATRRALINLSKCTEAGMCIVSVYDNGYGKIEYEIYLKNTSSGRRELKNNGQLVNDYTQKGNGYLYKVVLDRTQDVTQELNLEFKSDSGDTLVYSQGVGGKVSVVEAEDILENATFSQFSADANAELVATQDLVDEFGTKAKLEGEVGANDVAITVYGQALRDEIDEGDEEDAYVAISVKSPKINSLFSSKTVSMIFNFYNPGSEIKLSVSGFLSNGKEVSLFTVTLQNGRNQVEIIPSGNDWAKYPLVAMLWWFEEDDKPMFKDATFYLKDIVVYEA